MQVHGDIRMFCEERIQTLNRCFYEKLSSNPDSNSTLTSLLTAKYKSRSLRKS